MAADAREFGKLAMALGILAGIAIGVNWQKIKKFLAKKFVPVK